MSCNNLITKAMQARALGKGETLDWSAVLPSTVVALANYHLFQLFTNPAGGTYSGAALNAQTVTGGTTPSLTGGLLNFLDPTPPDQSYLLSGELVPQSAGMRGQLIILDLLAYYPGVSATNPAPQALVGAASVLPARLANGRNVEMMIDVTTALGALGTTCVITYTNRLGVGGRLTPTFSMIASSPVGRVPHVAWLLPLQAGDDGVQSIQTVDLGVSMLAGAFAVTLVKRVASIPIMDNGLGMVNWFVDPIEIPRVLTGAALTALFIPSLATASAPLVGALSNVLLNPN